MKKFSLYFTIFYFLFFIFGLYVVYGANTYVSNFVEGSSQSFTAPDTVTVSVDDGWTVSFWYKQSSPPSCGVGTDALVGQRDGENGWFVKIACDTGYLRMEAGSGAYSGTSSNVNHSDGNWTYVRAYFNGANSKLYVNNSLENTLNIPTITTATTQLEIGRSEGAQFFNGNLDDIRIYPSEYDGTNYNCKLTDETGLNAHWNLDNSLLDETANNNDLTNNNSVTFITTSLPYTDDCGSGGGGSSGTTTPFEFSQDTYWDLLLLSEFVTVFLGSFYLVFRILWK